MAQDLSQEEQRHVRENLSEDELALFDLILRETPAELSEKEKNAIKKGVRELLDTLKREKFVIDWKKVNLWRNLKYLFIEKSYCRLAEFFIGSQMKKSTSST